MPGTIPNAAAQMRRDLLSAYGASGSRILSWMIVSAMLYRHSRQQFAIFALLRATIGILNYTSLGLAPAVIHLLPRARRAVDVDCTSPAVSRLYANSWLATLACAMLGMLITLVVATHAGTWLRLESSNGERLPLIVLCLGAASIVRLTGDTAGAMLQASNHIARDNAMLCIGELIWIALSLGHPTLVGASVSALLAAVVTAALRTLLARAAMHERWSARLIDRALLWRLLSFGLLVTLAQAADYLYAPTDYLLITRLLSPFDVATYAPAVQIDGGLLVLVGALAAVLLPRSAIASASGDATLLRRYYLRGTIASFLLLLLASTLVLMTSPWIFQLWLGNSLPATRALLPLVLLNTTLGGASSVGRSILLGMGKVRAFTIAVLLAGAANVVASYCFVHYLHWGLRGIVAGTVVAVIGRCVIWMPIYVLKTLRAEAGAQLTPHRDATARRPLSGTP